MLQKKAALTSIADPRAIKSAAGNRETRFPRFVGLQVFCCLVLGLTGFTAARAEDASCPSVQAPGKFEFRVEKQNKGIVPKGFVTLGPDVPVVHGVDVSKWQGSVDLSGVAACGGAFAYIRLSAGSNPDTELEYRSLWANARFAGLRVGPYHYLTVKDSSRPFHSLSTKDQQKILQDNVVNARKQADLFASRLEEVLALDPIVGSSDVQGFLGQPYLPISLSIRATPQAKNGPDDQKSFGVVYAAAICAWIEEIRSKRVFAGQKIFLSVTPFIFKDYLLTNSTCGLDQIGIWIAYPTQNGGSEVSDSTDAAQEAIRLTCGAANDSRCVIHLYTSFGGFALQNKNEGLDLDRFYGNMRRLDEYLQRAQTF